MRTAVRSGIGGIGVIGAVALVAMLAVGFIAVPAHADEATIGYNPARTAWDSNEPGLAPGQVSAADFGNLFTTTLPRPPGQDATTFPNQVYAQPLVISGKEVVVATEENQVDALDPASGAVKWTVSLGPSWASPTGCGDLTPHLGITSTPVYDASTNTIYLGAKTDDGPDYNHPNFRVHALDADTGQDRPGWPVLVTGAATNSGLLFNAATANQRTGLLLMGGSLYLAFASHCDREPYVGYVASLDTSTRHLALWSSESALGTDKAGIWQSGGGIVSDGPGRLLLATGNGVSPAPGPGTSPPGQLAESVVRLAINPDESLTAKDFFSPYNNVVLDQNDTDLGSGSPVVLPDDYGTASVPHVLVQVGKSGVVYLLNRDNLGGNRQGPNGTDKVVSSVQLSTGVWGRPAIFDPGNGVHYIYLVPSTGAMQVLRVAPNAQGVPTLSVVGSTGTFTFPYTSGSPVVTSTGTDPATALVWVVRSGTGSTGQSSQLLAYPATPPASGPWNYVFAASLGTVAKFISPATDGGRVYVGTRDGRVLGFGRPVQAALVAPATEFGTQGVGTTSAVHQVTVTVQTAVTVSSVSTSGPFAAGAASVTLPHAFAAHDTFTVPVTFSPTAAGSSSGLLAVVAGAMNDEYDFSLHGTGTQPGLAADPAQIVFGDTSVGTGRQLGVTIVNTGTTGATIQGATLPSAPFTVTGLPAAGTVLQPQQALTATVQFSPGAQASYTDHLTVTADTGSVTVPLSGAGITGSPHMSFNVGSLNFGQVQPGASATQSFSVSNTGLAPLTITKAAPPSAPFVVLTPIAEGQTLQPGDSITVQVTYRPTTAEPANDAYLITSNDGLGEQRLRLAGDTGFWTGPIVAPAGCLDDRFGKLANGNVVQGYPCNGTGSQQWAWGPKYSLRLGSASSPWCLDVKGSGTTDGTPIDLYACNGTVAQQWTWRADNSLWNAHANKCLDLPSATASTPLRLYDCKPTNGQYWTLTGLYAARGLMSSGVAALNTVCLTDRNGSSTPGAAVEITPCASSAAQMVTHLSKTYRMSTLCMSIGGTTVHSKVVLWKCQLGTNEQWTFNSNGTLVNATTGLCLNVPGGVTTPHTQLELNTCSTAASERWRLPG